MVIVTSRRGEVCFCRNCLVVGRRRRGTALALSPARVVEQVAVRARPRVRLVADLHVRQVGARVVVAVEHQVVQRKSRGHADHDYERKTRGSTTERGEGEGETLQQKRAMGMGGGMFRRCVPPPPRHARTPFLLFFTYRWWPCTTSQFPSSPPPGCCAQRTCAPQISREPPIS